MEILRFKIVRHIDDQWGRDWFKKNQPPAHPKFILRIIQISNELVTASPDGLEDPTVTDFLVVYCPVDYDFPDQDKRKMRWNHWLCWFRDSFIIATG